jgi:signal peptidase II
VIGGALGNLYDRVRIGEVIDFADVYVGDWHWPAFNIADSAITVGVIVLLLVSFMPEKTAADSASAN